MYCVVIPSRRGVPEGQGVSHWQVWKAGCVALAGVEGVECRYGKLQGLSLDIRVLW